MVYKGKTINIWVVISVNVKQFNAGRHTRIAIKNIKILGGVGGGGKKAYLANSSGYKVDQKLHLLFQLHHSTHMSLAEVLYSVFWLKIIF